MPREEGVAIQYSIVNSIRAVEGVSREENFLNGRLMGEMKQRHHRAGRA